MKKKLPFVLVFAVIPILLLLAVSCATQKHNEDVVVGIAWVTDENSEFFTNITDTLDYLGIKYVVLDRVSCNFDCTASEFNYLSESSAEAIKNVSFSNTNVEEVIEGISGVIFTGGEDISPTLYKDPVSWHGIEEELDYSAVRDVSDYILMKYCIEKDIPVIGFCRGMQMIGVVSGATVIQDIPTYFEEKGIEYDYTHRNNKETATSYRDYAPHDVKVVDENSIFADIVLGSVCEDVPSWHHQAILRVDGTNLKVTGTTDTCGYDFIEAIQYEGKTFIVGFQFHPEAAIVKNLNNIETADDYVYLLQAKRFFKAFANACKK